MIKASGLHRIDYPLFSTDHNRMPDLSNFAANGDDFKMELCLP